MDGTRDVGRGRVRPPADEYSIDARTDSVDHQTDVRWRQGQRAGPAGGAQGGNDPAGVVPGEQTDQGQIADDTAFGQFDSGQRGGRDDAADANFDQAGLQQITGGPIRINR